MSERSEQVIQFLLQQSDKQHQEIINAHEAYRKKVEQIEEQQQYEWCTRRPREKHDSAE